MTAMIQIKSLAIFLFLFCTLPLLSSAQYDDIETDRPGRSTGSAITPKKMFQFEVGMRRQYDDQDGEKQQEYLYPTLLAKYGLSKKMELRVVVENRRDYSFVPEKEQTAHGLTPVHVGIKYNLLESKGAIPNSSILLRAALHRLASPDFKGERVAPAFVLLMDSKVSDNVSITYNAGVEWETDDSHAHYLYSITPQVSLTDKIKVFAEVYGLLFRRDAPEHSIDAGLLYFIAPNFQLDLSGGVAVIHSAPNSFVEFGCSFRLPH
jgi:hypothetical protein